MLRPDEARHRLYMMVYNQSSGAAVVLVTILGRFFGPSYFGNRYFGQRYFG